ncbi:DUF366 family protein [Heliorestis acidaminivorans]|uniref:DUF366 family protein n=1 Tax=Heliorestis acidaminivorans TaxID=553427 RepID=A0A6I0F654_9FIRM|nr:DUF366 family protein [Heliorestis acidaminivorans]KAB2954317.1 DUF366 family protein [Heliorestis acidaminivorans]
MQKQFIDKKISYDGSQLSSLWAYRFFQIQGDSIIAFCGPCQVELDKMVDLEDYQKGETIYSPAMLHFIIEHFEMDLEKTVLRQRLLMALIKEELEKKGANFLSRQGDDIYYKGNLKLSVSIATLTPVSTMIHVGLNLCTEGTPVPTVSLSEIGELDPADFAHRIMVHYAEEMKDIYQARCKVRGVE